eukprot:TRINITY_DN209_c0_g1_i1.p1 TRINITY_DN209_c0_g1~~TRINITY_DN209_c0_g1_i1.p1  ORF type:complete len:465 (-),score=82.95 TRINITY_DN209_c0_g1_i1:465-1832(-)
MNGRKILILICMILSINAFDVLLENGTTKHYYTQPFFGNKSPIVNGKIITFVGLLGTTAKELQACDKAPPTAFLNGSIAVLAPYGGCSIERHIEVAQNAGAVAVIVIADPTWKNCRTTDLYDDNNNIPAVCITGADFTDLIKIIIANGSKNPPQATIAIFNADPVEYDSRLNHRLMDWGTITFFIYYIILGVFTIGRIVEFYKEEGSSMSVPKILLFVNVLGCIFNAIIVIDMEGYRGWYVTIQYKTTYYYFLGTTLLYQFIIFSGYIANILVRFSPHKKILRWVNLFITALLFVTFTVANIVFCVYGYRWATTAEIGNAITIIIAVIEGVTALFFLFSATILVVRLASFVGMKSGNREQRKRKYTFLSFMLFLAFFTVSLGFSVTVAITSKKVQNNIESYMAVYFVFNINISTWLLIMLLVFNPRDHTKKSSGSSYNNKKSDEINKSFNTDSKL